MSGQVSYFAYGSNLWPARLYERVGHCEVLGVGRLDGFSLRYDKRGADGSGKGNVHPEAHRGAAVFGALYSLDAAQFELLHRFERGYRLHEIAVQCSGAWIDCITYIAQTAETADRELAPYSWYLRYVLTGARHHALPASYIETLSRVEAQRDPDEVRASREGGH